MPQSRHLAAYAPRGRWVIAHRGASGRYPENTLAAFRAAVDVGADFIELDVHMSADGEVVVMHDDALGRTCTGRGKIAELSFGEIRMQDAGAWKAPQFAGERVPTLSEVLREIPLPVMVEIKPEGEEVVRRVAEVVKEARAEERIVIASFSDRNLQWAAQMLPTCERLVLGTPSMARMEEMHIAGPHHRDANRALAEKLHRQGQALWCWTVDEPDEIARVIRIGADGIISNWPERVIEALT